MLALRLRTSRVGASRVLDLRLRFRVSKGSWCRVAPSSTLGSLVCCVISRTSVTKPRDDPNKPGSSTRHTMMRPCRCNGPTRGHQDHTMRHCSIDRCTRKWGHPSNQCIGRLVSPKDLPLWCPAPPHRDLRPVSPSSHSCLPEPRHKRPMRRRSSAGYRTVPSK